MFGNDHAGWMLGGGSMMLMWWLLPVALLVSLVIYWIKPSGAQGTTEKSALDILKERYARGEIGKEEFDQKKRDISS
jgi:putative membrane protein